MAREETSYVMWAAQTRNSALSKDARPASTGAWWLFLGLLVLAITYSRLYGVWGYRAAPSVQLRFMLYPVIFAEYFITVWLVVRSRRHPYANRVNLLIILFGAVILRTIILGGVVPRNSDLGRHLWEGNVLLEGFNPYAAPPAADVYDGIRERLASRGDDLYSGKWTKHSHVRSTYGPVATLLFAIPHLLPFDRHVTLRVMMTCFDLLTILLLIGMLGTLGQPRTMVVVYAWSPVCLNGFADRGQVDAAMVFLVVLAVWLVLLRRPAWAGVAFAGAILTKMASLLLLFPLLRVGKRWFGIAFALALIGGILPFTSAGLHSLEGLVAFASRWQENDSVYSILLWLLSPLHETMDTTLLVRALVAGSAVAYALMASARLDPSDGRSLVRATAWISAAGILLSPVTYPWYTTTMLAFLCFVPHASLLALSVAPMFWYLRFLKAPANSFWHVIVTAGDRWRQPWRVPVYGVVAALLLRDVMKEKCARQAAKFPESTTDG